MTSSGCPYPGLDPPKDRGRVTRTQDFTESMTTGMNGPQDPSAAQQQVNPNSESSQHYPQIGHDHPEGRPASKTQMAASNTQAPHRPLDFGWFSVPLNEARDQERGAGEPPRTKSRQSKTPECQRLEGQPSEGQMREATPAGQGMSRIPDGPPPGCQYDAPVDQLDMGSYPGQSNPPPSQQQQDVFEWPLSYVARSQIPTRAPQTPQVTEVGHSNRAPSRQNVPPPTPLPPVSLSGYGHYERPTFAGWSEHWHRTMDQHRDNFSYDNTNNNGYSPSRDYYDPYADPAAVPQAAAFDNNNFDDDDDDDEVAANIAAAVEELELEIANDVNNNQRMVDFDSLDGDLVVRDFSHLSIANNSTHWIETGRYVPTVVIDWTDNKPAETTNHREQKTNSKGDNAFKTFRSKFQYMVSSLKCWPTNARTLMAQKPIPYKRFSDPCKRAKDKVVNKD